MKALLTALVLATTSSFAMAEHDLNKTCLAKVKAVSTALAKANLLDGAKLKSLIVNPKVSGNGEFGLEDIITDIVVTRKGHSGPGKVTTQVLATDDDCIIYSAAMSDM